MNPKIYTVKSKPDERTLSFAEFIQRQESQKEMTEDKEVTFGNSQIWKDWDSLLLQFQSLDSEY